MKKFSVLFVVCCFVLSGLGSIDTLSADTAYTPMRDISMTGGIKGTVSVR